MITTPSIERTRLIQALDRIKAIQDKPNLRVVDSGPRGPHLWRKRYNGFLHRQLAAQRRSHCLKCKGTGELGMMGSFGEYEGTEPCWACQRTTFEERIPLNDIPF